MPEKGKNILWEGVANVSIPEGHSFEPTSWGGVKFCIMLPRNPWYEFVIYDHRPETLAASTTTEYAVHAAAIKPAKIVITEEWIPDVPDLRRGYWRTHANLYPTNEIPVALFSVSYLYGKGEQPQFLIEHKPVWSIRQKVQCEIRHSIWDQEDQWEYFIIAVTDMEHRIVTFRGLNDGYDNERLEVHSILDMSIHEEPSEPQQDN